VKLVVVRAQRETLVTLEEKLARLPIGAETTVIGRELSGLPDLRVDLSFDPRVSRRHAQVWQQAGQCWIEDLGSTNGTLVSGIDIRGQGPIPLEPGVEIQIGDTVLMLASPNWHRLRHRNLLVDLEVSPAINFSLVHCGLPLVSRLVMRNWGAEKSDPAKLSIFIPGCAHVQETPVPPLSPGESRDLPLPDFQFELESLENQTERRKRCLHIALDGCTPHGGEIECWVLAHNEFSYAANHWISLASFVMRNHPLVAQVGHDACRHLDVEAEVEKALPTVYEYLSTQWALAYRYEPPHSDSDSQKLRLPHQVLLNFEHRSGQGTCIDLALLVAASLEQMNLQPMIAILNMAGWRHALVGCWRRARTSLEPLLFQKQHALDGAIWVEPTGCTRDPARRMDFASACDAAVRCLNERPLLFALDVAAARRDGINPLPFAGEPDWSETAAQVIARAGECARSIGPLNPGIVHLLVGLLAIEGGATREVFEKTGGMEPGRAVRRLEEGLSRLRGRESSEVKPTLHHEQALASARALAKRAGSPVVTECNLLMAILEIRSNALEKALKALGATREGLLAAARVVCAVPAGETRSYSVFSEFPSQF